MDIVTSILYQPFFNLLIAFYALLERIPNVTPDMGLAVILLTVVFRILMLPLSIASTRSREERHQIEQTVNQIRKSSLSPEIARQKIRTIFRSNRRILFSEAVNFIIQLAMFFILYRIFTTGLKGKDLNLVYDFMPPVSLPFNLQFLGIFDLTHPNWGLNLFQSLTILAVEVINLMDTPYPVQRSDFVRYVIILPTASFLLFMFLPAGKKLFIITTLWFSFLFIAANMLVRWLINLTERADQAAEDKIIESLSPASGAKKQAIE